MPDYSNNETWQTAHQVALAVYQHTAVFPEEERFGLVTQMRRAAVSAASNLVEGIERNSSNRELDRFCQIAAGSLAEVKYQTHLSRELGYLSSEDFDDLHDKIKTCQRLLGGFRRWLRSNY